MDFICKNGVVAKDVTDLIEFPNGFPSDSSGMQTTVFIQFKNGDVAKATEDLKPTPYGDSMQKVVEIGTADGDTIAIQTMNSYNNLYIEVTKSDNVVFSSGSMYFIQNYYRIIYFKHGTDEYVGMIRMYDNNKYYFNYCTLLNVAYWNLVSETPPKKYIYKNGKKIYDDNLATVTVRDSALYDMNGLLFNNGADAGSIFGFTSQPLLINARLGDEIIIPNTKGEKDNWNLSIRVVEMYSSGFWVTQLGVRYGLRGEYVDLGASASGNLGEVPNVIYQLTIIDGHLYLSQPNSLRHHQIHTYTYNGERFGYGEETEPTPSGDLDISKLHFISEQFRLDDDNTVNKVLWGHIL